MSVPAPSPVLSFEKARHIVEQHAAYLAPAGKESLELLDSCGRILAEPIVADRNFPSFHRVARDGYAVIASDLSHLPASLNVIGEVRAGASASSLPTLNLGQAVAIMTGAPAPPGADAVVMVEYTSRQGNQVEITRGITAGENIVKIGLEAKRGQPLLSTGMRMDQAAIAVAAAVGKTHLS